MKTLTTSASAVNASYAYDALGRRVSKTVGSVQTVYAYCHNRVIAEYTGDITPPGGGSGVPTAENPTRVFVYGSYADEPVMMEQDGSDYYYHANRQYSVAAITDDVGTLVERYGYDSYGKLTVVTDDTNFKQPYYLTGRRLDDESGLYYFRARYYDAELGRFISRDPLGYVDGYNLYKGYFVPNTMDPSGMHCYDCDAEHENRLNELAEAVRTCQQDARDTYDRIRREAYQEYQEIGQYWNRLREMCHRESGWRATVCLLSVEPQAAAATAAGYTAYRAQVAIAFHTRNMILSACGIMGNMGRSASERLQRQCQRGYGTDNDDCPCSSSWGARNAPSVGPGQPWPPQNHPDYPEYHDR